MDFDIMISKCEFLKDDEIYNSALSLLQDTKKEQLFKIKSENAKRLCLCAELLLIKAAREKGYKTLPEIVFGEHKKPYFKNNEFYFNASHSGGYAALAVCDCEVGCDIEKVRDIDFSVTKKIFTDTELSEFSELKTQSAKKEYFFKKWVKKESYLKMKGSGITVSPKTVPENLDNISFFESDFLPGYKIAVCAEKENRKFIIKEYKKENLI